MDTVKEYLTHASRQLNDQRPDRAFTRWGRGLLLEYLNLGLSEIGTYRPEAFAEDIKISLVPGAIQSVPKGTTLDAITANADGSVVTKGDVRMAIAFNAYAVCADSNVAYVNGSPVYRVRSYGLDPQDSTKFYVDPPVPKGIDTYVVASTSGSAATYTLADWDKSIKLQTKYSASLVDYIMAAAYGLDQESAQSRARSDSLYDRFYKIMGVKYKQESKHKSGYYLGAVGTGDPQAASR